MLVWFDPHWGFHVASVLSIMNQVVIYAIEKNLHIFSGFLAAFVVFPATVFSRKGSHRHSKYGYISTFLACTVALTGALMLLSPMFQSLWAANVKTRGVEWQLFFDEIFYEPAFFIWLDIVLLYACFSAIRVWIRIKSIKNGAALFGWIDLLLSFLLAVSSLFIVWVGIHDVTHMAVHPFATMFIGLGLYAMAFVAIDIATFCLPSQLLVRYGWILHGYKFLFAWHALITAFLIRMKISFQEFSMLDTALSLLGYLSTAVLFWFYLRAQKPAIQSSS